MENLEKSTIERMKTRTYTHDYQPTYPDADALHEAQNQLVGMEGVATCEEIDNLGQSLATIARGESDTPIVITGNCGRQILMEENPDQIVDDIMRQEEIVQDLIPAALYISRVLNQNFKPRSSEFESDGTPSYYGCGINSPNKNHRTPDPSRMVAGAIQARDVQEQYLARTGRRLTSAHEALLLPFEECFVRENNSKKYLRSANMPWVGERTRRLDSPQMELLAEVENPVGVKVGPSATADDIRSIYDKLNPGQRDGKVVFTLRMGVDNLHKLPDILDAIKEHAPNSILLCDPMHGNTVNAENGNKTRRMIDIKKEVHAVAEAAKQCGLRLHGLHLEASGKDEVLACIDSPDQDPVRSLVDPELNNRQLKEVVHEFALAA